MIQVSQDDFHALMAHKLIKKGINKNYRILNKQKNSKRKKYYVSEEYSILQFLKSLGYDTEEYEY